MKNRSLAAIAALAALILGLAAAASGCAGSRDASTDQGHDDVYTSGDSYYVSPSGSDSNPGTGNAPWGTPGYASKQLKPGDTLTIMGGRYPLRAYWDDMVTPPSGNAGGWITIRGEEGERPVLAGGDDLFSAIDISNTSYIRIENLEITSDRGAYFREGINGTGGPVEHAVLKDLYIHHLDEGAVDLADVNDLQVLNCTMTHCGFEIGRAHV